jgi:hypothetical protein
LAPQLPLNSDKGGSLICNRLIADGGAGDAKASAIVAQLVLAAEIHWSKP